MKKMSETVVFFGSGPVAAKALSLLHKDFMIEAVVTKPVPAGHRGTFPVLELAAALDLKILTPSSRQELSALFESQPVRSTLGIVIDYGIIISRKVIDYFPLGIVNSHFSLLPKWRGADPITFSILNGDRQSGVSLMLINEKLDEGLLLAQSPYELSDDVTAPELTDDLVRLSHEMLTSILPLYIAGKLQPAPQEQVTMAEDSVPTYSRKLTKQDGILDWHKTAQQLEREVRAFIEWPKSSTNLANREVIITQAHTVDSTGKIGQLQIEGKTLLVYCREQALAIDRLKPASKPEMSIAAFLAGYRQFLH